MDDLSLSKTIEQRLNDDPELARTLVKGARSTIEPVRGSAGGEALEALRQGAAGPSSSLKIVSTLGEGGMGVVHLALQESVGRAVAVKTLRPGERDPKAALRMVREAWVTGALEHPSIIPIYDVRVDEGGAPLVVMKRVEGRSWLELMREPAELGRALGTQDPLEANLRVLISVCNAVAFAHSRGIVHRDIKPDNIMVGAFGEVYVLDWGIAVSLREDPSGRLPQASAGIAGTPCYMAPEMLAADPGQLCPQTDVYLLGAVFFEIFAGSPPHQGPNLQAMIASIIRSDPDFPQGFPAEARRVCQRAMSRDPSARHGSVDEFRVAVEDYLRHRGSRRLAREARLSHEKLQGALASEPSEERALAIFNLLGECRFGYRAALEAWPGNEAARRGLDQALLSVVEHEVAQGDPAVASALLREVSDVPAETSARVDAALRARAQEEAQLQSLRHDLDPSVGTRTRTLIGAIFGVLWMATPLAFWLHERSVGPVTHPQIIGGSVFFLILGVVLHTWARESLTKTLLNRRLAATLGAHLCLQMLLGLGAWWGGFSITEHLTLLAFGWCIVQTQLAIWVEPWFALSALTCAASFLCISLQPKTMLPLLTIDNLVLTLIFVRVWLPRQDVEMIHERRRQLRRKARQAVIDALFPSPACKQGDQGPPAGERGALGGTREGEGGG